MVVNKKKVVRGKGVVSKKVPVEQKLFHVVKSYRHYYACGCHVDYNAVVLCSSHYAIMKHQFDKGTHILGLRLEVGQ